MALPIWTILVATFGIFWFLSRRRANKKRLGNLKEIPGPTGFPILGNAHQLGRFPNDQFCKWSEQYGDIFQVKLGGNNTVIVSNPEWTREIFSKDPAFTGRLSIPEFQMYPNDPDLGIISSEGERWEVHRRFLLRQLRDFGFGKSSMEALIMQEVEEVINKYKKKVGTPVGEIREYLRLAVVNSLWKILTSKGFDQNDPALLKLANSTSKTFNDVIENGGLLIFMPWLRHIIPESSGYNAIVEMFDELKTFFEKQVNEHKDNFNGTSSNDFIDVYLGEMEKQKDNPQSHFYGVTAERQLATILFDLFIAGNDTTATTLGWTILLLCKNPNAQQKLQKEINEITGDSRKVSVDDRPNMPYTVALIDEILRVSSIVPDGVQHRAMADREFKGYFIEKDSIIQPNMYYIHHDKKLWGDPKNFRPERFLSPDGKKYVRDERLQAFQVGKRQCVGETLARDSIFLYLTNLFQQFSMEFDPNQEEPTLKPEVGFIRASLPYQVIMKDRLKK